MSEPETDTLFFDEPDQRPQLMKELVQSPETEIVGVVSASGAGGGKSRGEVDWTFTTTFEVWRGGDGQIREESLTIRKQVTDDELRALMKSFAAYDVVRIRARVAETNVFGTPQALLIGLVGPNPDDPELHEHARKLQLPVTFQHPRFGQFTLDRRADWFEGEVSWGGELIRLSVSAQTEDDALRLLKTADRLWEDQETWDRRIREKAVDDLLATRNESWKDSTMGISFGVTPFSSIAMRKALAKPASAAELIAHGRNCFCTMGAEIAEQKCVTCCGNAAKKI